MAMSDEPKEGLDRRDFMIATIASVGASAALAANTSAAKAQGTTALHDYRCYGSGNLRTTFRAKTGKISLLLTRKRVNSSWTRH